MLAHFALAGKMKKVGAFRRQEKKPMRKNKEGGGKDKYIPSGLFFVRGGTLRAVPALGLRRIQHAP